MVVQAVRTSLELTLPPVNVGIALEGQMGTESSNKPEQAVVQAVVQAILQRGTRGRHAECLMLPVPQKIYYKAAYYIVVQGGHTSSSYKVLVQGRTKWSYKARTTSYNDFF